MTERFAVEVKGPLFADLDGTHVVFHGINKSGSLAMAGVIGEAMQHAGRGEDFFSHYHMSLVPTEVYRDLVAARTGRFFAVGHYLYGSMRPAHRRIWITQFRHPLPRAVSAYQWLKNKHVGQHGTAEGFPELSDFVRQTRGIAHSQVIQFGKAFGRFRDSEARRLLPPKVLYELSVEAIERDVTCLGIAEHFEESIFCFAALCGLPNVAPWQRDTRNKGRTPVDELTEAERDVIREVYQWDFALYNWALRRFREQNARIAFGPSLQRYKAACEGQYNRDRLLSDPDSPAAVSDDASCGGNGTSPDERQERLASLWTEAGSVAEAPDAAWALEDTLAARECRIATLNEHVASQATAIRSQSAKIATLKADITMLKAQIARLVQLSGDSAATGAELQQEKETVARLRQEIGRVRKSRDDKVMRLTQRLERMQASHEATVTRLQAELAAHVKSWSWRITSPLRGIATQTQRLRSRRRD